MHTKLVCMAICEEYMFPAILALALRLQTVRNNWLVKFLWAAYAHGSVEYCTLGLKPVPLGGKHLELLKFNCKLHTVYSKTRSDPLTVLFVGWQSL